jgi:hypothetical protein
MACTGSTTCAGSGAEAGSGSLIGPGLAKSAAGRISSGSGKPSARRAASSSLRGHVSASSKRRTVTRRPRWRSAWARLSAVCSLAVVSDMPFS